MSKEVIRDVWAEYHFEVSLVYLMAERLDGSEFALDKFMPEDVPSFALDDVEDEDSDYGEYYNMALEEAHKKGFIIEGEAQ